MNFNTRTTQSVLRWGIVVLAALAPFLFPLPFTLVLAVVAGYLFPPVLILVGGLLDMLYFGGRGMPYYTVAGACGAGFMLLVQQFIKTRIMS
jgi:hypothetical protein